MESCSRKIHFCYGHRVMNHENKCANLHGHNGIIFVYATPIDQLDELGRIVDFSVLKEKIGGWVDTHWDHTMIINEHDEKVIELLETAPHNKPLFILPYNPTAENLARYLLYNVCPQELKGTGVIAHKIVFYETENAFVEVSLDPKDPEIIKAYAQ